MKWNSPKKFPAHEVVILYEAKRGRTATTATWDQDKHMWRVSSKGPYIEHDAVYAWCELPPA